MVYYIIVNGTIVYIDSFNLHSGVQDAGLKHLDLIDLFKLSNLLMERLTGDNSCVVLTRYFTARLPSWHQSKASQDIWLKTVETMAPVVKVMWGEFRRANCQLCPAGLPFTREKRTDVNIAVWALMDFIKSEASATLLITGDTDQVPTIHALKRLSTRHPVYLAFPPRRYSDELRHAAGKSNCISIDEELLALCQLSSQGSRV